MIVLAIGAHADDIELGIGGAISKHAENGDTVHSLIITHSGYSAYDGTVIRKRDTAKKEAQQAAEILGIKSILCLEYETKEVIYDVKLIEDINRVIDDINPDIVYTHWFGDINQDHSAISRATMIAARNIPRVLMYRSNWYQSNSSFNSNFYINITDQINNKINSIKAHKSEFERRPENWIEFIKNDNRNSGIISGVQYAEALFLLKWLD